MLATGCLVIPRSVSRHACGRLCGVVIKKKRVCMSPIGASLSGMRRSSSLRASLPEEEDAISSPPAERLWLKILNMFVLKAYAEFPILLPIHSPSAGYPPPALCELAANRYIIFCIQQKLSASALSHCGGTEAFHWPVLESKRSITR